MSFSILSEAKNHYYFPIKQLQLLSHTIYDPAAYCIGIDSQKEFLLYSTR